VKFFVGGPMQHAEHPDGFDPHLRHLLSSIIKSLETDHIEVLSAHVTEEFGGYDARGQAGPVTQRDFNWMRMCDIYIAVLPAGADHLSYRSDGTYVELGWASALRKPIVLVSDPGVEHSVVVQGLGALCEVYFVALEDIEISSERIVEVVRAASAAMMLPRSISDNEKQHSAS
jgi:nucleoside 2-deoxyribosyltransferase